MDSKKIVAYRETPAKLKFPSTTPYKHQLVLNPQQRLRYPMKAPVG